MRRSVCVTFYTFTTVSRVIYLLWHIWWCSTHSDWVLLNKHMNGYCLRISNEHLLSGLRWWSWWFFQEHRIIVNRDRVRGIYFFFLLIKVRYPISPKRICICDKLLTATNCSFVSSTLGYRARQLMYLKLKNLIIERNNRAGNFVLSAHIV